MFYFSTTKSGLLRLGPPHHFMTVSHLVFTDDPFFKELKDSCCLVLSCLLSIFSHPSGIGSQHLEQRCLDFSIPGYFLQLPWGDPQGCSQASQVCWIFPEISTQWEMSRTRPQPPYRGSSFSLLVFGTSFFRSSPRALTVGEY